MLELDARLKPDVGLAGIHHVAQERGKPVGLDFRHDIDQSPADDVAKTGHSVVRLIDDLEDEIRPTEGAERHRRLHEQVVQVLPCFLHSVPAGLPCL